LGKLLGFIISHHDIKANPEKISSITNMRSLNCIKDVQKLTGCMTALNKFISKLGERGLPFLKLLKHQEKFVWTTEPDQALAKLKDFLSKPPVLTAPRKKEQLLLYLAVTTHVVSSAIVVERQGDGHAYPVQRPVYFVSEVLSESKARYQPVQKLLYTVLITSRKLQHYFQEYSVSVITDYPLGDILRNQDANGRISKWVVELGALNIDFKPRTTIKSQALVDFMAVAGESAANSNRATRALGDVLRRLAQARRCRCRGALELSNGRTTQVRPTDLLEGLKQRSRV
jgi:hypothetical protein